MFIIQSYPIDRDKAAVGELLLMAQLALSKVKEYKRPKVVIDPRFLIWQQSHGKQSVGFREITDNTILYFIN
ncbi:MAG: hypothetical protein NTV66_11290 [Methylococcales bacterium]|jgi:hypothetical protein|nr:hypothetical protein [Methylococcales bacterium]